MDSVLIVSQKKSKKLYGNSCTILSPAKINLYLNILGKYSNGYHRIESIVERISLCDRVHLRLTDNPAITIQCNNKALQTPQNLCVKAARMIRAFCKFNGGVIIHLEKNIPVGAGLGGGSSNAASVILGLCSLLNVSLSQETLFNLGAQLGSDINFFLAQTSFAYMSGKGEKIRPFHAKRLQHTIIWPAITLLTKEIYKKTNVKLTKYLGNVNILTHALQASDIALLKSTVFNVLEHSACGSAPRLSAAKKQLQKQGIFTKVTGSGSAIYTISSANIFHHVLKYKQRQWSVFNTQTF